MRKEGEVLDALRRWAAEDDNVRGMVLTSSRVNRDSAVDLMSDYDVEIYVADEAPFERGDEWLEAFGPVLIRWPAAPARGDDGGLFRLVIYEDGVRIDWGVKEAERIRRFNGPSQPYRVLVDKDHVVARPMLTHTAEYNVRRPTAAEFDSITHDFWWDITYVAKSLWRDEIYWAKYMYGRRHFKELEKVIEWYIGMRHDWSVNTNKHGRWFKRYLDGETLREIDSTFAGADIEENWNALCNMTRLFRRLAVAVADGLGFEYPHDTDRRVSAYMEKIRRLELDAEDFV